MTGPAIIAHRGDHHAERENTLAAFEAAADTGADLIEFDVRRTADDQLVVFHDAEIARTPLSKLTHHQLCELSETKVPRLEEVLGWASARGIGLDVELKENGYVGRVAKLLDAFQSGGNRLFVTSFSDPVIHQLFELAPHLQTGLLFSMTTLGALRRIRDCHADAAVLEMKLCKEAVVAELAEAGVDVYVWDYFPARPGQAAWLSDARLEGFITDEVPATQAALRAAR